MANSITGRKDSIGPGRLTPNSDPSVPCWNTATMTPKAAPIDSRFMTAAVAEDQQAAEDHREQQERQAHHEPDEQRQLVRQHLREVGEQGGVATHQNGEPAAMDDGGDGVLAKVVDEGGGGLVLGGGLRDHDHLDERGAVLGDGRTGRSRQGDISVGGEGVLQSVHHGRLLDPRLVSHHDYTCSGPL